MRPHSRTHAISSRSSVDGIDASHDPLRIAVGSDRRCFIFGVRCSWRGAVANCDGSWGGCVDTCGVAFKLSNRFFGALAGARFFFGFRPRLLGIGKQWVGTD
jgi:hypothetical protein